MEGTEECLGYQETMNSLGEKGLNNGNNNNNKDYLSFAFFFKNTYCVDLCTVPILQIVNTGLKSMNHLTAGSQVVFTFGLQLLALISNSGTFH